jgi:hypothetical protein
MVFNYFSTNSGVFVYPPTWGHDMACQAGAFARLCLSSAALALGDNGLAEGHIPALFAVRVTPYIGQKLR